MFKQVAKHLRIIRLIVLLNVFLIVRGCDDVNGLTETVGFPFPYIDYFNTNAYFANFSWMLLIFNILLLYLVIFLIVNKFPNLGEVLIGFSFFLFVLLLLFICRFLNFFLFFISLLIALAINYVFPDIKDGAFIFDFSARIVFVLMLSLCFILALFARTTSKVLTKDISDKISNEENPMESSDLS